MSEVGVGMQGLSRVSQGRGWEQGNVRNRLDMDTGEKSNVDTYIFLFLILFHF